jgi:GAF domain-containing protein
MTTSTSSLEALRSTLLETLVVELRMRFRVDRCTLRLDVPDELYPVVHESRTDRARSLVGDTSVRLRGQPVVEALLRGADQIVQPDSHTASEDPAFVTMLERYGIGAQIVTAVRDEDRLLGMISLHELDGPRDWTPEELELASGAADMVAVLLSVEG